MQPTTKARHERTTRRTAQAQETGAGLGRRSGPAKVLSPEIVGELRAASRRFGPEAVAEKTKLLLECGRSTIESARVLIEYHDCLLFLLAYPQTAQLHGRVE